MRKITILATLLLAALSAVAAPVTPSQAQQAAIQFMQQRRAGVAIQNAPVSRSPRLMANGKQSTTLSNFYIFNAIGEKGYVIVSGDDRTIPILGYTDSGSYDPNNVPSNMQAWLDSYAQQISDLDKLGVKGNEFTSPRPTRNSISPPLGPGRTLLEPLPRVHGYRREWRYHWRIGLHGLRSHLDGSDHELLQAPHALHPAHPFLHRHFLLA